MPRFRDLCASRSPGCSHRLSAASRIFSFVSGDRLRPLVANPFILLHSETTSS